MIRAKQIQKVVKILKACNLKYQDITPNTIAFLAYNNNINLTSKEVVFLNNNYDN